MADVLYCSDDDQRLYRQSGAFTSTIKTSGHSRTTQPSGISTDGVHTMYSSRRGGSHLDSVKLYYESGIFSSTLRDSLDCHALNEQLEFRHFQGFGGAKDVQDIDWDGANTLIITARGGRGKLISLSGRFTTIIRQSHNTPGGGLQWSGISAVRDSEQRVTTLVARSGVSGQKDLYQMSGQFTDTVRTSLVLSTESADPLYGNSNMYRPNSVSYDGTDCLLGGQFRFLGRLYRMAGLFSTTVLSSLRSPTIAGSIFGICSLDWTGRQFPRLLQRVAGKSFIVDTEERLTQVTALHEEPTPVDLEDSRQYQVAPLETA